MKKKITLITGAGRGIGEEVGLNFLMAAGFNPQGMVSAFEKIRKKKWLSGSNIPSYLSTHPGIEERIAYLQERIKRLEGQRAKGKGIKGGCTDIFMAAFLRIKEKSGVR